MNNIAQNLPLKVSTSDPIAAFRSAPRLIIGQLGQTLDGFIATQSGESKYINSEAGLHHLHALRSAVDAVIVGVGCVNADDPNLTVRFCSGKNPVRIVIDPQGRVETNSKIFHDGISDVKIITCAGVNHPAKGLACVIEMPHSNHQICPKAIVMMLEKLGLGRILVEGGNRTLSNFIDAGMMDRLHLIMAPVILGGGLPGLELSPIDKLQEAIRPAVTLYPLGQDVLFDCDFRRNAV
ncbi:MAG: RibD family protein [Pseudomonadota bacterium]